MDFLNESFCRRVPLKTTTNVFRALHRGEIPNVDLVVDIYGSFFCALCYDSSVPTDLIDKISAHYKCIGGVIKYPQKNPHQQGWVKELAVVGATPPAWFEVEENNTKYTVTLTEKQHTGLFLDQRDNRTWVRENSLNKQVANLFSYTCSFSLVAALGGAKLVHSVDVSRAFLEWGKENFKINNLSPSNHYFFSDDVRDWIKRRIKNISQDKEPKFDLIICDPPSFGQGGRGLRPFKVEREWEFLCKSVSEILNPNGSALFSNNLQERHDKYFRNHLLAYFEVSELATQVDFLGTVHARYFLVKPRC